MLRNQWGGSQREQHQVRPAAVTPGLSPAIRSRTRELRFRRYLQQERESKNDGRQRRTEGRIKIVNSCVDWGGVGTEISHSDERFSV